MSDEDRNKALLRRFYEELWSKGNLEAIRELVAEDFVDHHPPPGAPPGCEGLAALVATWRITFPDMRETCEDLIAEGDKVAEFWYGEHLLELMQQLGAGPDFAASSKAQHSR